MPGGPKGINGLPSGHSNLNCSNPGLWKDFLPEILAIFFNKRFVFGIYTGNKNIAFGDICIYIFKGIAGEKNRRPPHSPSRRFKCPTFHECNQWEAGTPGGGGGGVVMERFINFLFKVGLGLDCDCFILFFSLHPLGPLNKN